MLYTLLLVLLPFLPQPDACYTQCGDNMTCLCDCLYRQAQSQRAAESYAEAVKTYRAVDALCPDKGAAAAIDSIYQTHRIWVYQNGAFAVATPLGEPLSAFEYYNPQPFKNGIGVCEDNNGRYFFVDVNGKHLNELPGHEWILPAEGGLFVVKKADRNYSVVSSKSAKSVSNNIYSFPSKLFDFRDSLRTPEWISVNVYITQFENFGDFSEGLRSVKQGGRWGYINKEGKILIDPQFDNVYDFSEGVALVQKDGKWGLINKVGKILVDVQFDEAYTFIEGMALVKKDNTWSYINLAGHNFLNIYPQFDAASNYSEEMALVQKSDKWGYIGKEGKIMIEPQFDAAYSFSEGVARVQKAGKWGLSYKARKTELETPIEEA